MHKAGAFFFVCAGLLLLVSLLSRPAVAAWPTDPNANVPLCTAACVQQRPISVSDGAGRNTLDLGAGQQLAPGLYLVRLTQGPNSHTTRAAVLRSDVGDGDGRQFVGVRALS